jgi:long-subunit acyl-CoA synthetase (AMP-forming)
MVGNKKEGESRVIRNAHIGKDELIQDYKGMTNLKEIFEKNVKTNPKNQLLGTRYQGEYKWKTF